MKDSLKNLAVFVALLVAILVWAWNVHFFRTHEEALMIQVGEVIEEIVLPYKLAVLSREPRDEFILIPIRGVPPQHIEDTWGAARSAGRTHEGTDIFATRGTPVYSATRGYVMRIGNNNLGGNIVFVYGAGGVRYYYAHLDRIAEGVERGEEVTTDTVLGFVGNTGNASNTPPHLHLGVYNDGPENPYPLLEGR